MQTIDSTPNIDRIELLLLLYLEKFGSISIAGKTLHLSPASGSRILSNLREKFKDALFVRSGYTMVPTPFCQRLLPRVRQTAQMCDSLFSDEQFDPRNIRGSMRICCLDSPLAFFGGALWKQLNETCPSLSLKIIPIPHDIYGRLRTSDVNVLIGPMTSVPDNMHCSVLARRPYCCVMSTSHPLANRKDAFNSDDLSRYHRCRMWHPLQTEDVPLDQGLGDVALYNLLSGAFFLESSDTVLVTDYFTAKLFFEKRFNLTIRPLPVDFAEALPSEELKMVWSDVLHRDPENQWLRATLMQVVKESIRGMTAPWL